MSIDIVFRPNKLQFDDFQRIDEQCFPNEPIGVGTFNKNLTGNFWGAFFEQELVGYSYITLKPNLAWISRICISLDFRNRGIGSMLMEKMVEFCHDVHREKAILYVRQDNPIAVRFYEKHGFMSKESSYQYVVPINDFFRQRRYMSRSGLIATPITELSKCLVPEFPPQWANIEELHDPPNMYVLVFYTNDGSLIGYSRLDPNFPGCFPFVVDKPVIYLTKVLVYLKKYLLPEKSILKLTFENDELADVCSKLHFTLNYRLIRMEKNISNS